MSARWPILVAALLALLGGVFGLSAGLRATPPSESAAIEAAAARYVRETGGAREDCAARPSVRGDYWLIVTCAAPGGALRLYPVDRRGRVLDGQDLS